MGRPKMTEEQKAAAAAKREAEKLAPEASKPSEIPQESKPDVAIPSLEEYIRANERDDIVIVRVWYPGENARIFQGRYSGIEIKDGELSCQWADGTKQ